MNFNCTFVITCENAQWILSLFIGYTVVALNIGRPYFYPLLPKLSVTYSSVCTATSGASFIFGWIFSILQYLPWWTDGEFTDNFFELLFFIHCHQTTREKPYDAHSYRTTMDTKSWTHMPTCLFPLGSTSLQHQTINKLFFVATGVPVS